MGVMPIPCPHFKITIVKRSQGQSAVAGAAYQSGERLFSEYDQRTKFYNKKKELVHAEIMLPSYAPPGYADRATLWNAVEAVENQWNSQLARRIVLAFPVEVPKEQYLSMIKEFCQEQFVSKGMLADFAIHDKGDGNPHAHILLTIRAMDEHGKWLPKARKVYDLDENGERIRLASGNWKCHKENTVDWNDQKYAEVWRHGWETITNRYLEAAGRPERVDLRSFERQGIQQIPTVHLGPAAHQMEKRGVETFLGNLNRDIRAANSLMQSIRSAIRGLQRWIADLNTAIQQGFDSLKDGTEYDNLFAASECRAKADWLIGMNGTRAFTKKYGRRQTIGRVQTPTLAMLTERQNKIQNFVKEPYYKVEITGNGIVAESERMVQEQNADTVQAACDGQCAVVGSIERKRKEQSAPKLYDLTTLQREANRYYGFTASQTLKIVQELYEEKLVTYPRTDSQYITEDMQQTMTDLLNHYSGEVGKVEQVVNNKKVTDHHAILPTLESCKRELNSLSGDKEKIFALIVWKMQQAVQPPYIYEDVLVTVCCQDRKFTAKYKNILQAGHTAMPVPFAEQEKSKDVAFPKKLEQGAVIPVVSAEKKQGFTSPPKAFTEDTLLSAMETAGNKEFEKDTEKKGLGTPATRAAILEKLVSFGYVERKGKQILPSAEGVTAIANIPDYLKSASMTAEWENELLRMEQGETKPANFMQGINGLLDKMLADLRQIPTVQESTTYNKVSIGDCPVCGKTVCEGRQNFYCSDRDCKFALWKESKYLSGMKKTLTKKMATDLLKKGRTHVKDFYSAKKDKTFAADLVMAIENGRAQYSLEFPKTPAKK